MRALPISSNPRVPAMHAALNHFDLAFVCDTTGSMGPFLQTAREQMVGLIDELSRAARVEVRLGVVEFRDHPPQDTLLTRAWPFTGNMDAARKVVESLRAEGGGDSPEAVLDGVVAACRSLPWRPHARRVAVLVGDSPPHGVGARDDGFPRGCPCGETVDSVSAIAEQARVTVYALGLTPAVAESFGRLCRFTGGEHFAANAGARAVECLKNVLDSEFSQLDLDRQVLDAWRETADPTVDVVAGKIGQTPRTIAASVTRLATRGLLA